MGQAGTPQNTERSDSPRRLVRTNYAVRSLAFAYAFVVLGLLFIERGYGAPAWGLAVAQFLLYPQLLFLRARRSANPVRTELDHLYVDAACLGAWAAALGFPTWITFSFLLATSLNAVVNRGLHGLLFSLGSLAGGAALALAAFGLVHRPGTGLVVTLLAHIGSLAYACAVGHVVYLQGRRLAGARRDQRDSEERYRVIAENAGDLIAMVDRDGRFLYASPSYLRVLHEADLEPGTDALRRLHPDDADRLRMALPRAIATGQARELVLRLVDRQGRIRQYKTRLQSLGEKGETAARLVMVSQDVTALHDSEERLLLAAHALEGMTEAILITAAEGTILTVNRAFTEITGFSRDEVLGRSEREVRNALQPAEFYEELFRVVEREGYWSGTTWSRRKNGSVYREWRSVRAVRETGKPTSHYVSVFYEIGARSIETPAASGNSAA
jgi:PAS domain S-box-containing protein